MQFAPQAAGLEDSATVPRGLEGCAIVIFGATGDLTSRMIVPALYSLQQRGLLPEDFAIVGFSRSKWNTAVFRDEMEAAVRESAGAAPVDGDAWGKFAQRLYYISGNYGNRRDFQQLAELLDAVSKNHNCGGNYVFYLSTPPSVYSDVIQQLGAVGLHQGYWGRVVLAACRNREAVRQRPHDRPYAQRATRERLFRIPDLPHRPLPRQRDGAEYPCFPAGQSYLRAALEPPLR